MGFQCGLVGLPNAGKSTLFNALTAAGAKVASFPFSTIDAQKGVVPVPDEKLDALHTLVPDKKKVHTALEFIDIAGLVQDAHKGEGLGNQFLGEIRNVDAVVQVVRCFDDPDVMHPEGEVDPRRDIELIGTELLLKDLETLERRVASLQSQAKAGDKAVLKDLEFFQWLVEETGAGTPLRALDLDKDQMEALKDLSPLTLKPILYVANVGDEGAHVDEVEAVAAERGGSVVAINGEIEMEVVDTAESPDERATFLEEWGIEEPGLEKLVKAGYGILNLVTFYTTDGPEARAWTVPDGTPVRRAAGKIHSDFEERFVQAEVIHVDTLLEHGSWAALRNEGLLRREGEKYVVQDGDVIHFVAGK